MVEMTERATDGDAEIDAFAHRAKGAAAHVRGQGARAVTLKPFLDRPAALVIGDLHHVIIETSLVVATDVEDVDEPEMLVRDLFIALDPLELPFEGSLVFEILAAHHLHGSIHACNAAGEVDLSVRPSTDAGKDLEIRNRGRVGCPSDSVNLNAPRGLFHREEIALVLALAAHFPIDDTVATA